MSWNDPSLLSQKLPSLPATHHLPLTPSYPSLLTSRPSLLSTPRQPLSALTTQWVMPWGSLCMLWPMQTPLFPHQSLRPSLREPPTTENPCLPLLHHQEWTITTAITIGTIPGQNGTLTGRSSTSASSPYPTRRAGRWRPSTLAFRSFRGSPPSWAQWATDSRSTPSPSMLSPSPHQPQPTSTSPPLTSYRTPSTHTQSKPWMGWETLACKPRCTDCVTWPISRWKYSTDMSPCRKRHASSASDGRTSMLWKRAWIERRWRSRSALKQHKYS